MSKFYQHLEILENDTVNQKVTKLKYIDDISDDEMTLYYFEDGSKCNELFIGTVKETDPKLNRRVMIELYGPQYKWTLERHEVKASSKKMKADDGVVYEAPDPGVHVSGMGGQNLQITQDLKEGIRIDYIQPKVPLRFEYDPLDNYRLSLHPELELGKPGKNLLKTKVISTNFEELPILTEIDETTTDAYQQSNQVPVVPAPAIQKPSTQQPVPQQTSHPVPQQQSSCEFVPNEQLTTNDYDGNSYGVVCKPVDWKELISHKLTIDLDWYSKHGKAETIEIKFGDNDFKFTIDEFKELLLKKDKLVCESSSKQEIADEDDVLINNMISRSKKKKCKIKMSIGLTLPPVEVYNTISNVYEEGLAEKFINSLTSTIPIEEVRESISAGLGQFYKQSSASNTKKEESQGND